MMYPGVKKGDRISLPREAFDDQDCLPADWHEAFRLVTETAVLAKGLLGVRFEDGTRAKVVVT